MIKYRSSNRANRPAGSLEVEPCAARRASAAYDAGTREAIAKVRDQIPAQTATAVWENAFAATWARGRGWALWKALITFAGNPDANAGETEAARRMINDVLAEHEQLS